MPETAARMTNEERERAKKARKFTGVLERVDIIDSFYRGRPGKQFQLSFNEVDTDQGKFPRFRIWFSTNPQGEIRPNTKAGHAFRNVQMFLPQAKDFRILQGRKQTWEMGQIAIQWQESVKKYNCWLLQDVERAEAEGQTSMELND